MTFQEAVKQLTKRPSGTAMIRWEGKKPVHPTRGFSFGVNNELIVWPRHIPDSLNTINAVQPFGVDDILNGDFDLNPTR